LERIAASEHPPTSAVALDSAHNAATEGHPDERMTEAEVRAGLGEVLSHLPFGSKKPFARLCGYRGKWGLHALRGVAKGRALLPEACRKRLSRILNEVLRGEWVLIETGMLTTAGKPSHAWRRHESLSSHDKQVPIKIDLTIAAARNYFPSTSRRDVIRSSGSDSVPRQ
jgi:hypothetical protein